MAAAMVDLYGKFLKLTTNRFMIKTSDNMYLVMSTADVKKLYLSSDDIDILRSSIVEQPAFVERNSIADAFLENTVVKYCDEGNYYSFVNKKNFKFEMALKRDTIERIVNFHSTL